jgi:hypothetical protein
MGFLARRLLYRNRSWGGAIGRSGYIVTAAYIFVLIPEREVSSETCGGRCREVRLGMFENGQRRAEFHILGDDVSESREEIRPLNKKSSLPRDDRGG